MSWLAKGLLLYLCITIAMLFWQPNVILGGSAAAASFLSLFNYNPSAATLTNPDATINSGQFGDVNFSNNASSANTQMLTVGGEGALGAITVFGDFVEKIFGWITLFFRMLFAPIIILTSPEFANAPLPIIFIFAFPVVFMVLMGIIYFARGLTE